MILPDDHALRMMYTKADASLLQKLGVRSGDRGGIYIGGFLAIPVTSFSS